MIVKDRWDGHKENLKDSSINALQIDFEDKTIRVEARMEDGSIYGFSPFKFSLSSAGGLISQALRKYAANHISRGYGG